MPSMAERALAKAADVVRAVAPALRASGFDIVFPTRVGVYNRAVATGDDSDLALPTMTCGDDTLAIIVGNTASMWPRFLRAYARSPEVRACSHPLDLGFVAPAMRKAFGPVLDARLPAMAGSARELRLVHETERSRVVAVARFAHAAGLAHLCPPAYLSVHPEHGPWISYRAVAVLDADASELPAAPPGGLPSPFSAEELADIRAAMAEALAGPAAAAAGSGSARSEELDGSQPCSAAPGGAADVQLSARAQRFLAVRDACDLSAGRGRFPPAMLAYHYDKRLGALRAAAEAAAGCKLDAPSAAGSAPGSACTAGSPRSVGGGE